MIGHLHAARKNEEGQALILASITMLILALCVLATVNITYAASQRIQLQNTADSAAYTAASYEARALNFLAYTNRAMIVQYVGQMNMCCILSYWVFNETLITMVLTAIKDAVQDLGPVGAIIAIILDVIIYVLQILSILLFLGTVVLVPTIDAFNFATGLAQAAVIGAGATDAVPHSLPWEISALPGRGLDTIVKKADPNFVVNSISTEMLHVDEASDPNGFPAKWGPQGSVVQVEQNLNPNYNLSQTTGLAAYDRLQMTELVNAARAPEVAFGTTAWTSALFFPRQWNILGPCSNQGKAIPTGFLGAGACIQKVARTEWGALAKGIGNSSGYWGLLSGIFGPLGTPTDEMFSLDRFDLSFAILDMTFGIHYDSWAYADRSTPFTTITSAIGGGPFMPSHETGFIADHATACTNFFNPLCWVEKPIAKLVNSGIDAIVKEMQSFLAEAQPIWGWTQYLPIYHFGQFPYARFRPATTFGGAGTSMQNPSATNLFNQPPVVLMVTAPSTGMNTSRSGTGSRPFLGNFGFKIGQISSAGQTKDAVYNESRTRAFSARQGGYVDTVNFDPGDTLNPLGFPADIPKGFHAMSAAMAYYHRPGDWREPPNLFNPAWGAKLMPVIDYPRIGQNPVIQQLLADQLMVH